MKIWSIAEKLLALDLNKSLSQSTLSGCTITYDTDGKIATVVDTMNSPNITYTLTYDIDDQIATVTDSTNTWTVTRDTSGNITSIVQS